MRRTTHHRTIALATLTLVLAGCGTQNGSGPGGSGTVSPSPSTTGEGCTAQTELSAADSGRTVCVPTGGVIRLSLDGTRDRPWQPVAVSGGGLEATNSGIVLQPGDAVSAFRAVSAGKARLTSSRPLCVTDPARASCKGLQEWTVTVVVTKA
ncbi:hypothetical protein AQJ43_01160 [Streptomyces avermitilis]|nr:MULTISPECIES: hypothetical protein [Streptomyces]KUN56251.1 hypothetical protein AQJ43_01160 [Streptomyces avermitilis]MYS98627.1 hypothetical protein [Streptomyces sp. SID5469]OOV33021.1 hypothetical protein SM007_09645 [Streptomyces avermitilis]BBJ50875.1 hypothetical protein SAVMC3_35040 [Streptomyces avermitilis]GDY62902.1 hypothetical protein SAV14893_022950 [Streptomyces avermitilis]